VRKKGLAGINMNEIAKTAGLATGTVYIYFKNKETLINLLFAACRKASIEQYLMNYSASDSFEKGFKIIWNNILQYRIDHFEEIILMDQCYHSPFMTDETLELNSMLTAPLFEVMERGKKEGYFKPYDSFTLLNFMIGSIHERIKHVHYSNTPLSTAVIENLYTMCLDGLKRTN
jgi:AcrR family transcriptional regulator